MVFLWNFNPRKQREQSNNLNLQHLIGLPIFFSNLSFFNSRHLEKRFEGLLKLHVFSSLFFFSVLVEMQLFQLMLRLNQHCLEVEVHNQVMFGLK